MQKYQGTELKPILHNTQKVYTHSNTCAVYYSRIESEHKFYCKIVKIHKIAKHGNPAAGSSTLVINKHTTYKELIYCFNFNTQRWHPL